MPQPPHGPPGSFDTAPPNPTEPDLLIGIFEYLKENNLTRDPLDEIHQKTLPPLWVEQRFGCPAPGGKVEGLKPSERSPYTEEGGPGLVVEIRKATGIPPAPFEGFLRIEHVEFVIRAEKANIAYEFEQKLRSALNDKRGWMMSNVPVNESLLWRDLQPITRDNLAYTYVLEYQFQLWGPFTLV